jgi:hypothetical protein
MSLGRWPDFSAKVHRRLKAGAVAYQDRSFGRDPDELLEELQAEALDLAGWGFILWSRIEAMRGALRAPRRPEPTEPGET